ncbi:hypothetical protein [Kribbella sp. NPDC051770]|uniref:hypothetical protein n=1 Tax=Kribbella sp. NPDC051770 TaxID=3155413 RepID=UPI0034340025
MKLVRIGYWDDGNGSWPDVRSSIDPAWDEDERDMTAVYLRHGLVARAYMGPATCRVCGRRNGSVELTDFVYVWPEGLSHYLLEHQVRLPEVFVEYVRTQQAKLDDCEIDDSWWRGEQR